MQELIPINVVIGDRSYRIRIAPGDEELVRKTLKSINDKILAFKTEFAGKDMQDYIAMVLLWFATDQVAKVKTGMADETMAGQLDAIEQILDNQLKASQV